MTARVVLSLFALLAIHAAPAAQTDLDTFMQQVLQRRAESWKTLQQYVLQERETFEVTAAAGARLYGFRREYAWFPRDGLFVRSPLTADGVAIDEAERRREEERWARREQRRARRQAEAPGVQTDRAILESLEPGFVSAGDFLKFTFEPGRYALAGREQQDGREVLRVEYYPTRLFREGRTRPHRELRREDSRVGDRMNKTSLVTLWIDRAAHQILRYEFENVDLDFLPARSLLRIDELHATLTNTQAFPAVWLPSAIDMRFTLGTAAGPVQARYGVRYSDYRLASVTTRVR